MTDACELQTKLIQRLNDAFRRRNGAGKFLMTAGVASLPLGDQAAIMRKVMSFDAFTPDNDPYSEHDFGAFEHNDQNLFWKIDLYEEPCVKSGNEEKTITCILTIYVGGGILRGSGCLASNAGFRSERVVVGSSIFDLVSIPAAAVSMRTSALTCIRSKGATPSYHNRYARMPEPEGCGRRTKLLLG